MKQLFITSLLIFSTAAFANPIEIDLKPIVVGQSQTHNVRVGGLLKYDVQINTSCVDDSSTANYLLKDDRAIALDLLAGKIYGCNLDLNIQDVYSYGGCSRKQSTAKLNTDSEHLDNSYSFGNLFQKCSKVSEFQYKIEVAKKIVRSTVREYIEAGICKIN